MLLEHETLDKLDAYAAAQMPPRTADTETPEVIGGGSPQQPRSNP